MALAALQLLHRLCEPRLAMAALCRAVPPGPRNHKHAAVLAGPEGLPAYAVLAAAADAVLELSATEHAACAAHAQRVLQHLRGVLAASPRADVQALAARLDLAQAGEGEGAPGRTGGANMNMNMNGGTEAPAGGAEPPTDEAIELVAAGRAPIWPRAWRVQPAAETLALLATAEAEVQLFGAGAVQTALFLVDDDEHPSKRARTDEQADGTSP